MVPLSSRQKQLLFDYCIGLTTEEESTEAESLIASNEQAAEIHSAFKAALSPLDTLEPESCPDDVAEGTIFRLNNLARSGELGLQQLLAAEQSRKVTTRSWFWGNLGKRLATAAVFMIVGTVVITAANIALNCARQKSLQQKCQFQLGNIFQGFNNYSSDHQGQPPAVAAAAGSPWWKVGYQGKENQSNTRRLWLLVKDGYVKPEDFVCAGRKHRKVAMESGNVNQYNDFPSRDWVTYSFRIECKKPTDKCLLAEKAIMADMNPLFENLPKDFSIPVKIQLNKALLNLNSINHNRRGQNVLFGDGSVRFIKIRSVGIDKDDIFTLQGTQVYEGVEVPAAETDAFLAP